MFILIQTIFFLFIMTNNCHALIYPNFVHKKFESEPSSEFIKKYLENNSKTPILLDGPTFAKKEFIKFFIDKSDSTFSTISIKNINKNYFENNHMTNSKIYYVYDFIEHFSPQYEKKLIPFMTSLINQNNYSFVLPIMTDKYLFYSDSFFNKYKTTFLKFFHLIKFNGFSQEDKKILVREKIKYNEYTDIIHNANWNYHINYFEDLMHIEHVLMKTHKYIMGFIKSKKIISNEEIDTIIEYFTENEFIY